MDPIELTRALVPLESPTFAEGPVVDFLDGALRRAGYTVVRQPVTTGRDNLYAYRERPELVFSTHLDCVPPFVPLREDDFFLYGRGACDAKGIAAAMVAAAERLAGLGERRIGLLFLVGEENGSDGAAKARELGPRGRFIVNGEPTENALVTGSKGSLRVDLESRGRAAHSAYPSEGASAILPLLETLRKIRRLPVPFDPRLGETTMNIGTIQGGVAPNVIPAEARAQLLYRTIGPTQALKRAVEGCLEPGVTATFATEIPALTANAVPGWESTVVSYASDLPFLAETWGEGYMLGPGSIRVAHTDEERIAKAELRQAVDRYVRLATDLLHPTPEAA
jgi:acetylornithine deacetylase